MNKKKIRILYIHHGGAKGGAPRSLAFLINNIDKSLYEPYVVVGMDYEENKKLFESVGANVIYKKYIGAWHGSTVAKVSFNTFLYNLKHCIPTYFRMFSVLKEVNPDIVHLNSTCLFLAAKAVKKYNSNIPIVCHVREQLLPGFWGDILRNNVNNYVDRFIAIEKYDAQTLKTSKKTDIIYNFIDFKTYNENIKSNILRKELNINENEKILLYLARISPGNGAYEMLISLENFIKKNKDIHICLVGAEYEIMCDYLKKVLNFSEKNKNVHVLPFRNDVPNIIASSDLLIAPFTEPHFARSVIEAAAMGVPSIVSNVGGLDELVVDKKTGVIYNTQNHGELEEKIKEIINDEAMLKQLSKNAIEYAHKNFDSKINSNRTFKVYEELLKKRVTNYEPNQKKFNI